MMIDVQLLNLRQKGVLYGFLVKMSLIDDATSPDWTIEADKLQTPKYRKAIKGQ